MNRQQKEAVIADLRRMFTESQATFIINYKGMSVPLLQGLRKNLRSDGNKIKIAKATLMRLAASELSGVTSFSDEFKDQIGLVFAQKDVSATAKQLVAFSKENAALKVVAGFYESKILSLHELNYLASLPSREVLLGQLLGTMQAPISGLVRALNQITTRLVYVLKAIEEKQAQNQ